MDLVRGIAIIAMAIFHGAWDVGALGLIAHPVADLPGWRLFARCIAGTFLILVGVSLVLANRRGLKLRRFGRRLAMLAVSAAAVTVVTWFVFPDAFIFFGILHSIAVASVLGLPFLRLPVWVAVLAAIFCLAAPHFLAGPVFDAPALQWLGLMDYAPQTNDYVPVFPWFGCVLAGMVLARLAGLQGPTPRLSLPPVRARLLRPLVWAGRHSLAIYLIHQPLLFGIFWCIAQAFGPNLPGPAANFVETCQEICESGGTDTGICTRACGCVVSTAKSQGIWPHVLANQLSPDESDAYQKLGGECRAQAGEE
nr:heparan-alpha-glucosaminide N-acetyltransferase [Faunimonas pinastri]